MTQAARPDTPEAFVARLRDEGSRRYHDHHPFHVRMHEGKLSRREIQAWVENRFYYQTRIPIKDALILSKSDDPAFRRQWMRRIVDHDGAKDGEGGLELWLKLAVGVGLDREATRSCANVLPGVRFACDAYVTLVREKTLLEAVASSLTEFFSPDIMSKRIAAWETHYPWVAEDVLEYFRTRVVRAKADSSEAIDFVVKHATTRELQDKCVAALITKTHVLWCLLDAVQASTAPQAAAASLDVASNPAKA
jgi:pyrroloquinoline-quinone synthase